MYVYFKKIIDNLYQKFLAINLFMVYRLLRKKINNIGSDRWILFIKR